MTVSFSWSDTYTELCNLYGQTPRPQDEQAVLEAFERNPRLVIAEGRRLADADVTWKWSVLVKRVQQAPARDVVVTAGDHRGQAVQRAERWIRNAGVHFDAEHELVDELFGGFGCLREWAGELALMARMVGLWREERARRGLDDAEPALATTIGGET